jgi:hypothetical protein
LLVWRFCSFSRRKNQPHRHRRKKGFAMSYMQVAGAGFSSYARVPSTHGSAVAGSALESGLNVYGKIQSDKSVADLARAQAAQQAAAAQSSSGGESGFPIVPVAILAGAGLLALVLLVVNRKVLP